MRFRTSNHGAAGAAPAGRILDIPFVATAGAAWAFGATVADLCARAGMLSFWRYTTPICAGAVLFAMTPLLLRWPRREVIVHSLTGGAVLALAFVLGPWLLTHPAPQGLRLEAQANRTGGVDVGVAVAPGFEPGVRKCYLLTAAGTPRREWLPTVSVRRTGCVLAGVVAVDERHPNLLTIAVTPGSSMCRTVLSLATKGGGNGPVRTTIKEEPCPTFGM